MPEVLAALGPLLTGTLQLLSGMKQLPAKEMVDFVTNYIESAQPTVVKLRVGLLYRGKGAV